MRESITLRRTGQQGVILEFDDTRLGIDLFLTQCPGRLIENTVEEQTLLKLDFLFGTHDHEDHIDRKAWTELAKRNPLIKFVVPDYFQNSLPDELGIPKERFVFCKQGQTNDFGGLKVITIPAAHEKITCDAEGRSAAVIYMISYHGFQICHMGDSCYYEGLVSSLRELGPIDILLIPINGRDEIRYENGCLGNFTYQEAVDVTGWLQPKLTIPGHYDMYQNNSEDPQKFKQYLRLKYPACQSLILPAGKALQIKKAEGLVWKFSETV